MRLEWVHESHVINCQNTCKSVITQEWPTDVLRQSGPLGDFFGIVIFRKDENSRVVTISTERDDCCEYWPAVFVLDFFTLELINANITSHMDV